MSYKIIVNIYIAKKTLYVKAICSFFFDDWHSSFVYNILSCIFLVCAILMSLSVSLFVLFVSFVVMSETIDRLFMPSLDRLAKQFKLSDNVAGATLLAIGTSMPEISTAMVALFVSTSSPIVGVGTII
jgi:hypothetical protein